MIKSSLMTIFMVVLMTLTIYLAVHSVRCSNTVGAAGEGFVAVVALHRLNGGVGRDHPLQGDRGHWPGSETGGHGDDDVSYDGDDNFNYDGDSDVS